uniref:BTB domain-containing protein n=1 Tax=Eptatretus burgeri TaxID=7764 RepID=A0A8C4WY97_EPTBU
MDVAGHGRRLLSALEVQRHRGELCDCVLVAEGQEFRAHRAVLAAWSEYFHICWVVFIFYLQTRERSS